LVSLFLELEFVGLEKMFKDLDVMTLKRTPIRHYI
jgi:hypothetical protein